MRVIVVVVFLTAWLGSTPRAFADAAITLRAGEWETHTTFAGGPMSGRARTDRLCHRVDKTIDPATMKFGASLKAQHCSAPTATVSGGVTAYSIACDIGSGKLNLDISLTRDGPDAFTEQVSSRVTAPPASNLDGLAAAMVETRMTRVMKRLGACPPEDVAIPK